MGIETLLRRCIERHGNGSCFTCSFQVEDIIVLDIVRSIKEDISVIFLDTGYHFPEVYEFVDRLEKEWNLNLKVVKPEAEVGEFEEKYGKLYETDPDKCCKLRKVQPLLKELENYTLWITGLRREQSPTRANLQIEEVAMLPSGKKIAKLNPLAFWTWKELWKHTMERGLPYLELYDQGYRSIGCQPCTSIPIDDSNPRSGRWSGRKLECGIHTFDSE